MTQVKVAVSHEDEKAQRLIQIFPTLAKGGGQTLVFVEGRKNADKVARDLTQALTASGYTVDSLHGTRGGRWWTSWWTRWCSAQCGVAAKDGRCGVVVALVAVALAASC